MSLAVEQVLDSIAKSDIGQHAMREAFDFGCLHCRSTDIKNLKCAICLPKTQFTSDNELIPEMGDDAIFFAVCHCREHQREAMHIASHGDLMAKAKDEIRSIIRSVNN